MNKSDIFFTNDAVVLGILLAVLALIFHSTKLADFKKFYKFVPSILLCFFIPGLLSSFHIISAEASQLDEIASKYLLPTCLIFFTISIDFQALKKLGTKSLLVFLAGAVGVMIGGPISLWVVKCIDSDYLLTPQKDEIWRGLATIAGSWTGGNANQIALKEIFQPSPSVFAQTSVIDVFFAELWLGILLYFVGKSQQIDKIFRANHGDFEKIKHEISTKQSNFSNPNFQEFIQMLAVGFGGTAIAHQIADLIVPFIETNYPFLKTYSLTSKSFWIAGSASAFGIYLSTTRLRKIEKFGTTQLGTVFLYFLIATIGMQLHLIEAFSNPILFLIGLIWIFIHGLFTILAAYFLKVSFFYTAVGSQANVGGVASSSVIAAAFHPSLAPIGVLLAIFGNAIGTYCGYISGLLLQWIATN